MHRICLVGAGNVSATHAEALSVIPDVKVVAVCDPDAARAETLAHTWDIEHRFGSVSEGIASETFGFAHVLVPPDRHADVAERLLGAGIGVLVEKPMATSVRECRRLVAAAQRTGAPLGVNHNALFFPAYRRLREHVLTRRYGALEHLTVLLNVARDALPSAAHWMVRRPNHVAFESAVHPLSQIYDLAGPLVTAETAFGGRREIARGVPFYSTWMTSLVCERATAQMCLTFAGSYPTWQIIALCEDGVVTAEMDANVVTVRDHARWGRFHAPLHLGLTLARQQARTALRNTARELGSALSDERDDPYFRSMTGSLAAFHRDLAPGRLRLSGTVATEVVAMCEAISASVAAEPVPPRSSREARPHHDGCDVLVTGGSGFIGRRVVERLLLTGASVRVLARQIEGLPALFEDPHVELIRGDVSDPDTTSRAVEGARRVVHLATGTMDSYAQADATIRVAAEHLARRCLLEGVERLVFAGTIASLYLGAPGGPVTGSTPTDPRVRERGPYGWAKARAEEALLGLWREEGLPVCVLRPGVVLGQGGNPFHSGFGIWRAQIHCVGWNDGLNPLPLVLADDVAAAILLALERPQALGRTFNLVGSVRLNARECVEELRRVTGRQLVFHPVSPLVHHAFQLAKWTAKTTARRRLSPVPSLRMIRSMGCVTPFDCGDVERELGWSPTREPDAFVEQALRVHGSQVPQVVRRPRVAAAVR